VSRTVGLFLDDVIITLFAFLEFVFFVDGIGFFDTGRPTFVGLCDLTCVSLFWF